jgi:hypothetical protein
MPNLEHLNATMQYEETAQADPREACTIEAFDLGDPDARNIVFDVYAGNIAVRSGFRDKEKAAEWANDNGYRIETPRL